MITRCGHAGDFEAVLPMMRKHRQQQQQHDPVLYQLHPDAEQRFRRWVGQKAEDPRSTLLVAEEDGRIIGFLTASVEKDPPMYQHAEFALVREWWVEPEFSSLGAAKALIDRAAAEFAAIGIGQIRFRTCAPDEDARALLSSCGFRSGACEMVMELQPRREG